MTAPARQSSALVVPLPVRRVDPKSPAALLQLAQRRAAWNRTHPHATADEQLAAGAAIAAELGL